MHESFPLQADDEMCFDEHQQLFFMRGAKLILYPDGTSEYPIKLHHKDGKQLANAIAKIFGLEVPRYGIRDADGTLRYRFVNAGD